MPYYSELGIYASPTSGYSGVYIPGPYSNHSSIVAANFIRTPPSLLKTIPRNFRGYKPHLTTISEAQSPLRRINSPKILLTPTLSISKPIKKINTADIDVSVNKYRKYERNKPINIEEKLDRKSPSPTSKTDHPAEPQKDAKPSTTIRRDRATIRIQTVHKDMVPAGNVSRSWRDNFHPNELHLKLKEEEKRPKKSPGELLKEKFLIRSENEIPEKKISRRASKKYNVQKTPSFHDICTAITSNRIDEELNPGQPLEIQRRQSRQFSAEDLISLSRANSSTDLQNEIQLMNQKNLDAEKMDYDSRGSVRKKKKTMKKKSNEKLVLPGSELDTGNKSGIQRRPTQRKIRRTSTDSSIGSDIVDAEVEKAYQEAIRDISQVEIETIPAKPKPIITATIDVDEKPSLKAVVDHVEVVESPKPKKGSKFKFNVIVEEIEEAKQKNLKQIQKNAEQQSGTLHTAKAKEPIVSNILQKKQSAHLGHILDDIKETPKEENEASVQNKIDEDKKKAISIVKNQSEDMPKNPLGFKKIVKSKSEEEPIKLRTQIGLVKKVGEIQKSESAKAIQSLKEIAKLDEVQKNHVKVQEKKIESVKSIEENKKSQVDKEAVKVEKIKKIEPNEAIKEVKKVENIEDKKIEKVRPTEVPKEVKKVDKTEPEKPVEVPKEEKKVNKIEPVKLAEVLKEVKVEKIEPVKPVEVPKEAPKEAPKVEKVQEIEKNELVKPVEAAKEVNKLDSKPSAIKKPEQTQIKPTEHPKDIIQAKKDEEIKKIDPPKPFLEKKSEVTVPKKIESKVEPPKPVETANKFEEIKQKPLEKPKLVDDIKKVAPVTDKSKETKTESVPKLSTTPQPSDVLKKKTDEEVQKPAQNQLIGVEKRAVDDSQTTTKPSGDDKSTLQANKNETKNTVIGKAAIPVKAKASDENLTKLDKQTDLIKEVKSSDDKKSELTITNTGKIHKNASGENFWATIGPRESVYVTKKIAKPKLDENITKPEEVKPKPIAKKAQPAKTKKETEAPTEKEPPIKKTQPAKAKKEIEPAPAAEKEPLSEPPEDTPKKAMPSKRSLVNKAVKDDPDLEVFEPPEPEPEPEPEPKTEAFVPLQSNRLSQFMHPFKKPEQYEECPVEIFARPKTIRKRHYPRPRHAPAVVQESEEESDEEEDSSDGEDESSTVTSSSDEEYDVNVVYGSKVGASTSSNDSGFDSGVPGSRNKDCDVNCHKKCEKLTANLCGVNQKLIVEAIESVRKGSSESRDSPAANPAHNPAFALDSNEQLLEEYSESSTFASFQKSGRITPPATTIPRFRKYAVEDFNFLKVLGKGSFGKVLLAELKNTEYYYAIKCLKKDVVLEDDDVECTLIERKVLALGTKHPYLCHLLCTFQTESHLFFVMEYLNGGDLMFHIQQSGRFPEARARFYGAEIVSGLKFLHNKGIVYRDLKLDNILLDFDGHVRIADFGMCKLQIFLDRMADTFCGTPDYMAPEIIRGQHYNQCVDWWSFGVLLYEMLIGQSPFSGCDEDELFWSICNEKPVLPRFLSSEASTILLLFLEKDGNKRLGHRFCPSGDIQDQPFFKPIQWDRLEARQLESPFKPNLQHPLDTQYFDRTFTVEKAKLTPIETNILQSMDQTQFQGFSYTNPNATDK